MTTSDRATTRTIVWPADPDAVTGGAPVGGKAGALASLAASGLPIPEWFVVVPPPDVASDEPMSRALADDVAAGVARLGGGDEQVLYAVRSSARDEDGVEHSFAGQFESWLYVPADEVPERVADVWRSAQSRRVAAYRRERGIEASDDDGGGMAPAALVQRMIDPDAAGVAFSADPVRARRAVCIVAATPGVGSALVAGDVDGDTWEVARDGAVTIRAHAGATPVLTDAQVRDVAALARAAERHFGRPQDIEWAIDADGLWLLQSRPITSLASLPDPDGALLLWDNSNITESYGGVTTPLTYSFARYVYEEVYRQFCRILGVPESRIEANGDALRSMLGLVRGRVYYNLVSWYRTLALLPGYRLNRSFMEQMMGVREGLPPELEARIVAPSRGERWRDAIALARSVGRLVRAHRRLPRDIAAFRERLGAALAVEAPLDAMRADELVAHYRELERALLRRWDAPLVNDFFAMIFFGVLKKLTVTWCRDEDGSLQNDLVAGEGGIVSAEPARRMIAMAARASADPSLVEALREGTLAEIRTMLAGHPDLSRDVDDYLATFGDRCLEELKLETVTLGDDPMLLFRQIGALAGRAMGGGAREGAPLAAPHPPPRPDIRGDAETRALAAIGDNPIKVPIFRWVMRNARERVRDRENLRFERTRVFGRVRRIVVELGKRYAAVGALDDARDVFHLTIDEVLGWTNGTTASADLRGLVAARRAEFERYRAGDAPDDRFETRGMVHAGHSFRMPLQPPADGQRPTAAAEDDETRRGIGCYPGVVRGRVRVVRDPRTAVLDRGEILVAERTDPGWVMLFPAASALLVERGSLLSHSAIVARELGLPAVVSIPALTTWLATGDEVEMDGRTGVVRRLGAGGWGRGVDRP